MRRRTILNLLLVVGLSIFHFISVASSGLGGLGTQSQKQYHFAIYETQLEVQRDANIVVMEKLTYHFEGGAFHTAYRYINLYKLESVEEVQVFGPDGTPYEQVAPTEELLSPGQFFVKYELTRVLIQWFYEVDAYFSPIEMPFTLKYMLTKAVQREGAMDVLDVDAVPAETPRVERVAVMAILPDQFSEEQVNIALGNQGDLVSQTVEGDKTILQFTYQNLPSGQAYRIIVGFPHTVQDYISPRRLINDSAWVVGILWVLGTMVFTIYLYLIRSRDPAVTVPTARSIEFSPRPPHDLLPGEGVSVLKEGRDPSLAAFATFADLARQGYVRLEADEFEDKNPRVIVTERGEEVLGTKGLTELLPVEEKLLRALHELEQEKQPEHLTLKVLQQNKDVLKAIGNEIMDRTMAAGYFDADPRIVRNSFAKKVGVYFIGASLGLFFLVVLLRVWGGLVLLGASIVSTICLAVMIPISPRKNERGAAKASEYQIFLKEVKRRAELAKDEYNPKVVADLIENFFPWLLIASIPTSFNLYNWLKAIETMPEAKKYPYQCTWYHYPSHLLVTPEPPAASGVSAGVPSSLSSFAQSFSASLGSIAASMGASSAGGGVGAGAGAGGGAGGGGAGAA